MNALKEEKYIAFFCADVCDLLRNEKVMEMKNYPHHGKITTHFHSVYVAYTCHKAAKRLGMNTAELTRAALLHDLYLYNWYTDKHDELHAWYHPKMAVINAEKYVCKLTDKQKDMIYSHMWPLHLMPPKTVEGFILTFSDKHCANMDLIFKSKGFLPIYNEIMRRVDA